MDVHLGNCVLHGAQDVAVMELGQVARQAALDADFCGPEIPSLNCLLRHLLERKEISIGFARASAERAELATNEADISEVDVAIDDVCHDVSGNLGAKAVRSHEKPEQIITTRVCKRVGLLER